MSTIIGRISPIADYYCSRTSIAALAMALAVSLLAMVGPLASPGNTLQANLPPPTLSGETLVAGTHNGVYSPDLNPGEVVIVASTCSEGQGERTIAYNAQGPAAGPYPGIYEETGTIKLGDPGENGDPRKVEFFEASFEIDALIDDEPYTVTGTKRAPVASLGSAHGDCFTTEDVLDEGDTEESFLAVASSETTSYEATIETPSDTRFRDRGNAEGGLTSQRHFSSSGTLDGEYAVFGDSFHSELSETQPITPEDNIAPDAPTLDLAASSDSGSSDSDDKTNDDTPTFVGRAEAGSIVEVFDGGTSLDIATANIDDPNAASGNKGWSFSVPSAKALTNNGQHAISAKATDATNNTSDPSSELKVMIDKDAPAISFSGGITSGAEYYYGEVPPEPICTATDGASGSGVNGSCVVSGYKTNVGSQTLTGRAKDVAGNEGTGQLSYTVRAWTLKGFYQPTDMDTSTTRALNMVKSGSSVPLKFEVLKGSTELTDPANIKGFSANPVNCGTGTPDDIEVTSTGGTVLRYDATAGQFIQNWQTPKKPGACYDVTVTTQDGTSIPVAHFQLK